MFITNWPTIKRGILIGSLRGPNFAKYGVLLRPTTQSQTGYGKLLLKTLPKGKSSLFRSSTSCFMKA